MRSCAGKTHRPLIVDVVDPAAIFKGMAHKREQWYREQGFRVDVGALKLALSVHDAQRLLFLGHPMRDGFKCVQTRTCCTGRHRRCDHGDRRDYYARNLSRPNQWPLGGAGYVLSRALLHSISASQWAACERGIRRNGGDVRVASCVWSHTRVGLGWLPGLLGNASRHPAVC